MVVIVAILADQQGKTSGENIIATNTALLKQNRPNPSNGETIIEYALPSNLNNANLVVYDLEGKVLQSFAISGSGNLNFDTSALASGAYIYSVINDGKTIASQKMIVQ